MKLSSLAGPILCLFALSFAASGQSGSVSGDIRGTITDSSGAVLAKVTVKAADPQTGLQRTVASDTSGQFRLTGLPPGSYELTAQLPGFATGVRKVGSEKLRELTDLQSPAFAVLSRCEII